MPIGICVNQVGDHIVAVSVYVFLAWVMKVELLQDVSLAAYGQGASGSVVHLDGVAIVDDIQWRRVVIKFESSETEVVAPFMSMGDCLLPTAHAALAGSNLLQFSGPS